MIDRKELTKLLNQMTYSDWLYKAVKKEMLKRGNWRDAPRGKPFVKGNKMQSKDKS